MTCVSSRTRPGGDRHLWGGGRSKGLLRSLRVERTADPYVGGHRATFDPQRNFREQNRSFEYAQPVTRDITDSPITVASVVRNALNKGLFNGSVLLHDIDEDIEGCRDRRQVLWDGGSLCVVGLKFYLPPRRGGDPVPQPLGRPSVPGLLGHDGPSPTRFGESQFRSDQGSERNGKATCLRVARRLSHSTHSLRKTVEENLPLIVIVENILYVPGPRWGPLTPGVQTST